MIAASRVTAGGLGRCLAGARTGNAIWALESLARARGRPRRTPLRTTRCAETSRSGPSPARMRLSEAICGLRADRRDLSATRKRRRAPGVPVPPATRSRRQLAIEMGVLSRQLTELLCAAGCSVDGARDADVHELAVGVR